MIDRLGSQEIRDLREIMIPEVQISPGELFEMHPLSEAMIEQIRRDREVVGNILSGADDRLLVVVGPCSLDDKAEPGHEPAVLEYAKMLKTISEDEEIAKQLFVVMRCPPAKPRTSVGPRGMEQIDLIGAHGLLHAIVELGLPLAVDLMNEKHLARYGDLISLGWVGARDMSVTTFRHTLSAFPEIPLLVKNNEAGDVEKVFDALKTIATSHVNVEVQLPDGRIGVLPKSEGSDNTGVIFRGGADVSPEDFMDSIIAADAKTKAKNKALVVDCSHSNAAAHAGGKKDVQGQIDCAESVLSLLDSGRISNVRGVMLESYIHAGRDEEKPGFSNTDPCISIQDTAQFIERLAKAHGNK